MTKLLPENWSDLNSRNRNYKIFRISVGLLIIALSGCSAMGPQTGVGSPPPLVTGGDGSSSVTLKPPPLDQAPLSPESVLLAEAGQYHAMAVSAAERENFVDAEYGFEKALELLAKLDSETSFTQDMQTTLDDLLSRIGQDYRKTVVARGGRSVSPEMSAFMMKFEDLDELRNWREYAQMQRALEPDDVTYNVPIVWNDRVKNCLTYFQTIARSNMEVYLARSGKYLPMMKKIFMEYDLPTDLCYLPIIESGFNPKAYSYARASGPWQFIRTTGENYGLKKDWWVDERRDFVSSTHSAAKYLGRLYEMFGDWYLALAAYNGGEGRVSRTIKKQKTKDFWKMRLRKQTENYVPLYLASLIIAKDPERFGFFVEYETPIDFETVHVSKPIDLSIVAKHIGASTVDLKALNPELLRGVTPPRVADYALRVPVGLSDIFESAYADIPQSQRTEWIKHKIRRGESLSTIARRYGVPVSAVKDANRLRSNRIIAGRQLTIPVPLGKYKSSGRRTIAVALDGRYRVRAGDTMWDIAKAHHISVESLAGYNNISSRRRIYPGQILKVPGSNSNTSGSRKSAAPKYASYRVRSGDSLWKIAKKYGTSVSALSRLNNLSSRGHIYPGQALRVPASGARKGTFTYVVRRGDNLSRIAVRFGVGVTDILSRNKLSNPERIAIGMKLLIPEVR